MTVRPAMRRLALALCLGGGGPVVATDHNGAEIAVTGTRTGEGEAASATTIGAGDIARLQPPTLLDALDGVAGVRAFSTGGTGGGSYVTVRGGEPNFTMVLLDGVRLNDTTNSKGGGFDFTLIDPALVDTVTVERGAASAVYGSDALSGVIDIRLREPAPGTLHGSARITGGTNGDAGGGLSLGSGWRDGGVILAGSGFHGADAGSRLGRAQGMARARQRIGRYDARLLATYAHARHRIFPEDSGGPALAVNRDRETGRAQLWATALSLRHEAQGVVRPELSLSYAGQASTVATPAIFSGMLDGVPAMTARNRLSRVEATGAIAIVAGPLVATFGAGLLDERGRSRGTIDYGMSIPADFRLDRTTRSGFAEATVRPARGLTLNGALRHDSVAGGPATWTGRAGIAVRPMAGGPALFARIGQGFKLPSFYALGNPLVGNPDLKAERSRNAEAGAQWTLPGGRQVRVAWFDNRFTDLIDFDAATFRMVNRAHVRARGLEASAAWRAERTVTLTGALTYLALESATPLRGRPRWQGRFGGTWQVTPRLEAGGALRFNSRFHDSSVPTGPIVTNGHAEADMSLRYAVTPALRIDLALRNIGDARDWQAVGYPQAGRTLRATVQVGF